MMQCFLWRPLNNGGELDELLECVCWRTEGSDVVTEVLNTEVQF